MLFGTMGGSTMPSPSAEPKDGKKSPWSRWSRQRAARDMAIQAAVLLALVILVLYLAQNGITNLKKQGIASGFGFLDRTSGFGIIQHLVPYDEKSTFGMALFVAFLNTLVVSLLGMLLATLCGFALGIARVSPRFVLSKLSLMYIETVRNIPLLLQIFFWYFGVLRALPLPAESWHVGKLLFLNIRGLYMLNPFTGELPHLGRFNIEGGICLLPEFVALLLALTSYTAAFIAEIVRAGIQSVSKGQWEAALALGLTRRETMHLVILPQALKVIMPPLTSQWLNLTKNSSLGAAIGYPELALVVAGTVLLQTGQAVEVMALTMGVYLSLSLMVAALSHRLQKVTLTTQDHRSAVRGGR